MPFSSWIAVSFKGQVTIKNYLEERKVTPVVRYALPVSSGLVSSRLLHPSSVYNRN
jgi:hypothetical protein